MRCKQLTSFLLATTVGMLIAGSASAQVTAYEGARVIVGDGRVLDNTTIVVSGSKITQVGGAVPAGATRVAFATPACSTMRSMLLSVARARISGVLPRKRERKVTMSRLKKRAVALPAGAGARTAAGAAIVDAGAAACARPHASTSIAAARSETRTMDGRSDCKAMHRREREPTAGAAVRRGSPRRAAVRPAGIARLLGLGESSYRVDGIFSVHSLPIDP